MFLLEMSPNVPIYSDGPVGPKIVEAALKFSDWTDWLLCRLCIAKKWPIKPIKVPFKNQSNGCTAYLKPIRRCTEVRLLLNSFNNFWNNHVYIYDCCQCISVKFCIDSDLWNETRGNTKIQSKNYRTLVTDRSSVLPFCPNGTSQWKFCFRNRNWTELNM